MPNGLPHGEQLHIIAAELGKTGRRQERMEARLEELVRSDLRIEQRLVSIDAEVKEVRNTGHIAEQERAELRRQVSDMRYWHGVLAKIVTGAAVTVATGVLIRVLWGLIEVWIHGGGR